MLAEARFAIMPRADEISKTDLGRPLYRLHKATFLLLIIVGAAFVFSEMREQSEGFDGSMGLFFTSSNYGWPEEYLFQRKLQNVFHRPRIETAGGVESPT